MKIKLAAIKSSWQCSMTDWMHIQATSCLSMFRTVHIAKQESKNLPEPKMTGLGVANALKTTGVESIGADTVVGWTESISRQLLSPPSHPELLGRLDRYEIERLIGVGGMGVVFKAYDSELSRPVAIKVLAPSLQHNGSARQRFAREARAAAAVVHQHVVAIHDVETGRELPYLVMHYVAGESLQARIDRQGALELKEILRIGLQIADGLSAAHQQGLVHRDIKPSNILMENANVDRALITDFGLARAVDDVQMTRTGTFMGTPRYMSPEQTRAESVDQKSDLFSLGSVLYTMCTAQPAFVGDSPFVVMKKIGEEAPKPIRNLNPDIPDWLCVIIGRLHAKQPADRFESAEQLRDLLSTCLSHVQQPDKIPLPKEVVARNGRISWPSMRLRPMSLVAVGIAVIVACSLPWFVSGTASNSRPTNLKTEESNSSDLSVPSSLMNVSEVLGFGFSRKGDAILCDGVSIADANSRYDLLLNEIGMRKYHVPERLADDIDVNSFRALSESYAKDRNAVYYKQECAVLRKATKEPQHFPKEFLLLRCPLADPNSFEVVTKNLAKDNQSAWFCGRQMQGVDPKTLNVVREDHVWKDREHVWYQSNVIEEANPRTFQHVGDSYYRDDEHVFWATRPIDGADPQTFRMFDNDLPYGRDRDSVWYKNRKIDGIDPNTFDVVHGQVYKDKNGVYVDSIPLRDVNSESFRKLADIFGPNALLSDGERHYLYLTRSFGIHQIEIVGDKLLVSRDYVDWNLAEPRVVATTKAVLSSDGWSDFEAPEEYLKQVHSIHKIFRTHFEKAWKFYEMAGNLRRLKSTRWTPNVARRFKELAQPESSGKRCDRSRLSSVNLNPDSTSGILIEIE